MSGEIICSGCDTVVEVTANSVELPFVCRECREVAEYNAKHLPQEHAVYSGLGQVPEEHGDPGDEHDGATVENTTLLIADLEEQNDELREQYDKDSELIKASNALVQALKAELTAVYKEDSDTFAQASDHIDALEKVRSGLQSEVDKLGLDVISLRKRANYYLERNNDLFHEVMFYRHQGLFGRLRGRRYEA